MNRCNSLKHEQHFDAPNSKWRKKVQKKEIKTFILQSFGACATLTNNLDN